MKYFIRFADRRCRKCGRTYLDAAFDDFSNGPEPGRSLTHIMFSSLLNTVLRLGCVTFQIDVDAARSSLSIPYFKRGLINVLEGISRYGVTRPQRLAAPFLVVWNFTNACNLRCRHCYQRAGKPATDALPTEEAKAVIDQLDEMNVSSIAFSGGEPLMRRDFFKVAGYAAGKGLYVSVATNGTLLTKRNVQRLKEAGVDYVEVSLDGADAETQDSFRGFEGAFDRTVHGIRNAVEGELYTGIAVVSTRHNLYEIPEIIELAKGLGVDRVIVFNFIPTGRGAEMVNDDISLEQREELLKYLYRELFAGGIEALSTAPQYARVCLEQSLAKGRDITTPTHFASLKLHGRTKRLAYFLGGCGAGRLYCAIQPNGLVTPCVFMPIVIGDLRKKSLRDIWANSDVLRDLCNRDALKGRCGHCPYRNICGGCRARAYAYYGDYMAPDPGCIREREEPSASFSQKPRQMPLSGEKIEVHV